MATSAKNLLLNTTPGSLVLSYSKLGFIFHFNETQSIHTIRAKSFCFRRKTKRVFSRFEEWYAASSLAHLIHFSQDGTQEHFWKLFS